MDLALVYLHAARPDLFTSTHRYDYRITNAYDKPISVALGDSASEATDSEILKQKNLTRVHIELDGCSHVILCGKKANLLLKYQADTKRVVIPSSHIGNRGLNSTYKIAKSRLETSNDRREIRIQLWVKAVLNRFETFN